MLEGAAIWYLLWIAIAAVIGAITKKGMKYFISENKPFKIAMHGGAALWIATVFTLLNLYTPQSMTAFVQNYTAPIKNTVSGVVEEIFVQPLQHVKKGQPLYRLDNEPYLIALKAANADMEALASEREALLADNQYQQQKLSMMMLTNKKAKNTYSTLAINGQEAIVRATIAKLDANYAKGEKAAVVRSKALWDIEHTTVFAPADGTIPNTFLQEGMTLGAARPAPYKLILDEQYVMMPVNYQGLMKVKAGNKVEFATPAYPLQVMQGEVVGVLHAGESDSNLFGSEAKVRQSMGMNYNNKQNLVKVKLHNPPKLMAGTSGMAWISTGAQPATLSFVNVIRGIIIRMKAQIYVVYSL